jgi:purine nucleoside permease
MRFTIIVLAAIVSVASALTRAGAEPASAPIPIRVVVVTTFELGNDTGDAPGEFQYWVTGLPLPRTLAFPLGYRSLRYDPARGILGIVTGEGAERGAASIMALGTDPRFDLSHAYWVVAGIAGVDPNVASVGSAAWANDVVNGDLGFEIDARETPRSWPTGILPFDRNEPYKAPPLASDSIHGQMVYGLDRGLTAWAYRLTKRTPLPDDAHLRAIRAHYTRFPNARRAPFVLRGDSLGADRFWIGTTMNAWAERWVAYWTHGAGTFAMTAEEDAGIMQSLTFLSHANRVDLHRVLVLRTASDYDAPGRGQSALTLLGEAATPHGESAYLEALDAAYRVGSRVVVELASHWDRYRTHIPGR